MPKTINRLLYFFLFFQFGPTSSAWASNCPVPVITTSGNSIFCQGDSVFLQASAGQSYLWSDGRTSQSIYAKVSGNYSVAVTDANNCTATSAPFAVTALTAPDAALRDTVDNFMNCTYNSGAANFNLTVDNFSQTIATNSQYAIEWGDGQVNTYGPNFASASHTYHLPGTFLLKLTVTNAAGCQSTKTYQVFNGSNPSFGVASQGNTNDCAPATFTFDIINTLGNTPSTVYTFQFDDGTPALTFTHATLPRTITHTFTKGAWGKPGNAFTLTAYATNPCGTTPATVGGIRISSTPIADFTIQPGNKSCVNMPVQLTDLTNGGFNANASGSNTSSYTRLWEIIPATGWSFINGTNNASPNPALSFSAPGTYTISLTASPRGAGTKCQPDSKSQTIVIQGLPTAAFTLTQPAPNCTPALVTMHNQSTGSDLTFNWTVLPKTGWNFTANTDSSFADPKFTFTSPGSYTISLTTKNFCGQTSVSDSVIIIRSAPEVSLPGTMQYCISQTVAFNAQNPAHTPSYIENSNPINLYQWQVIGTSGSAFVNGTTANSQFPEISFPQAGTYYVILKARNSCGFSQPDTQMVIINPAPQVSVTNSVKAICAGQGAATLTATGADSFRWFPAMGLNQITGATVQANPAVTTTYSVIGTNNVTGCEDTVQVTVIVKPALPVAVTATQTAICLNQQSTTITASGADTYSWSPATGLNITSGNTVIANPSVTTTYTVVATDTTAGCSAFQTILIEVLPLPVVSAGPDSTICANPAGLQLKGNPAGGTWTGGNITTGGLFSEKASGTYTVTYSYTNANGCVASDNRDLTVVPMPVVSAGTDTAFCTTTATVSFKGMPSGGAWTGNAMVTLNGEFTATTPGVYTLTYTYGNGNCQVSDQKTITIYALPAAPTFAATTICPGETATINLVGNATRYEWYDAFSGGNLIHTGAAFTTPVLMNSTTYFVTAFNAEGCASGLRLSVPVTVNPIVAAPVTANVTICGPGVASLTASGNAATFEWYDAPVNGNLLFTGANFQPTVNATSDFYVQAISAEQCPGLSRTKATVLVQPLITNNTISADQTICEGTAPATLNGSQPTGGNNTYAYAWESSTDGITFAPVSGAHAATFTAGILTQTTWFRRVVNSGVCESISSNILITVIPKPQAPVTQNQTICAGATATLNVPAVNGVRYEWYTTTTGGQLIGIGTTFTTPALQNTTEYFIQAINTNNCLSAVRSRVVVTVLPVIANNFISAAQTICTGETPAAFTGSLLNGGDGTYNYLWQTSTDQVTWNTVTGTNTTANYASLVLTQTTWFRRIVSSGPCNQHISTPIRITVLPGISNNSVATASLNVCFGNTPSLISGTQPTGGNGNYTYQWQSSTTGATSGFLAIGTNGQSQNFAPGSLTQTTWFRRVVSSGNCSDISAAVRIEVIPNLAANTIAASQTIYANAVPVALTGSAPTGGTGTYTYTWEMSPVSGTTGFVVIPNATTRNYAPQALNQTTWFRRSVQSGDCNSVSNVVEVTVIPEIANNIVQADQTICQNNQPDILTGTQPVGGVGTYGYVWEMSTQNATSGFSVASGTNNQQDYQPGILTQTTWFRRNVSSGANSQVSNAVQITVNPNISNNLISAAQTLCAGSAPNKLEGTQPTGGSGNFAYIWESSTTSATTGFVSATGTNTGMDYTPGKLQQTTWFRRRISAGHCSDNVSPAVKITINVIPAPPTINPIYTCANTTTTISIPQNYNNGTSSAVEWYEVATGGQLIFTGPEFTTPVLTNNKTYYSQIVQDGCASARTAVEVRLYDNLANAGEDVDIIEGKSTQLQASGGVTYKWFPIEGLSNPAIANPIAKPLKTTIYTLEVVSETGCVTQDKITVTVLPKIYIPNTFTPNNDGVNDFWEIKGLSEYRNCQVTIFNRWGQQVYHSTGYNKPFEGLSPSGEELPVATYYYIIQLRQTEAPLSGSVTIVR
jgi:gliding motility-associated-like protein